MNDDGDDSLLTHVTQSLLLRWVGRVAASLARAHASVAPRNWDAKSGMAADEGIRPGVFVARDETEYQRMGVALSLNSAKAVSAASKYI